MDTGRGDNYNISDEPSKKVSECSEWLYRGSKFERTGTIMGRGCGHFGGGVRFGFERGLWYHYPQKPDTILVFLGVRPNLVW